MDILTVGASGRISSRIEDLIQNLLWDRALV